MRPVAVADAGALAAFFAESGSRCYCQYWQYPGDHRQWQVVCAQSPVENERGLLRDLSDGRLFGLVSESAGRIDGWLRVERESGLGKLYGGRLYRGLPCFAGDRSKGATIACLLVRPELRRRGLATALIGAAIEHCERRGDRFLEAFPRGQEDVTDEEQWMGPKAAYLALGFQTAHDFPPYPVLRLDLPRKSPGNSALA